MLSQACDRINKSVPGSGDTAPQTKPHTNPWGGSTVPTAQACAGGRGSGSNARATISYAEVLEGVTRCTVKRIPQ